MSSGSLGQDSIGLCVYYLVLLLILPLSSQHGDLPFSLTACPAELSLKGRCQLLSTGRMSPRGWDRMSTQKMGDTSLCNHGKSQKEILWYFQLLIRVNKLTTTFFMLYMNFYEIISLAFPNSYINNCLALCYWFQCQPYMVNTRGQTPKKIIQLTQNFASFGSRIGLFPIITQRVYKDDS